MCVRLDQPQQAGPPAIWRRLSGCGISWQAEAAGAVQVAHRAGGRRHPLGDDVFCRVLAVASIPRASEQAADVAAVINLARAVAVVWLLLLLR